MRNATSYTPLSWQRPLPRITPARRRTLLAQRDSWLREIDPASLFHRLLDLIPGISFFAKNRQGELMFTGQASRSLHHLAEEAAVIGLTDFDLNPPDLAQSYVKDDERIYATGEPLLNRVEVWFDAQGMPDWFVVTKLPIRSRRGEIIGIMGFSQTYEGRVKLLEPYPGISKAVTHLRRNYLRDLAISDLARLAGMSTRQLERKFKSFFGVGPQQFLIKTRLLAACRVLRGSDLGMADVALSCGFTDQSAFSRHFRRHFGITPTQFRRCRTVE